MPKLKEAEKAEIIINATAILIGEYNITRKYAAVLLLKALLPHSIFQAIIESEGVYPFERNDCRVRKWTKEVLKRGRCENCGATANLEAHHIIKWADYPRGRVDINNGRCLCHQCHTNEHKGDRSYHMMKAKRHKGK